MDELQGGEKERLLELISKIDKSLAILAEKVEHLSNQVERLIGANGILEQYGNRIRALEDFKLKAIMVASGVATIATFLINAIIKKI